MRSWRKTLERELRRSRPRPGDELVRSIVGEISPAPVRRTSKLRLATAGALTAGMTAALASVGGISYAANAARGVAEVVQRAVAPAGPIAVQGLTAGGDQYRPGFGFGDPNHNHTGPPGLQRAGGPFAPPLRAVRTRDGRAATVRTSFTIDEQAHLTVSVVDRLGRKILLTQSSRRGGSTIGRGVTGPQTKNIQYSVLVPRTIPMRLRIPYNLLRPGVLYRIVIRAKDPDGNVQAITIPFMLRA